MRKANVQFEKENRLNPTKSQINQIFIYPYRLFTGKPSCKSTIHPSIFLGRALYKQLPPLGDIKISFKSFPQRAVLKIGEYLTIRPAIDP